MVFSGINYRETYFEFPELTKLQGEPNSESLHKLRNELKANAQAVYSNLSDGTHGHLALVLSNAQYALLTAQPFVRPVFPGSLAIPAGTTGPMAAVLKDSHQEAIRIFREVQGVEKALIQQIVQAVEAPFLSSLRDRSSNSLRGTVYEILSHLQEMYGRVSPQMLEDRDNELRNLVYNIQLPIETVFNAVEDYVDFAELGHQPLTVSQTIAKAYVILNKTRRFKNDITDWNRRPAIEKTWANFKTHFRRAHQEFRETTDTTLEDSELQRNNANLVQQVVNGMQQAMAADTTNDNNAVMILQMTTSATQASETNQQLNGQIQQMQQAMNILQAQVAKQGYNQPYCGNVNQGYQGQTPNQNYQGPPLNPSYQNQGYPQQNQGYQNQSYQGQQYSNYTQHGRGGYQGNNFQGRGRGYQGRGRNTNRHRNTAIYCWSHGGCGHASTDCQAKRNGHQTAATFENKMGGNTRNCQS
jgi:type II secretory pathway component PulJ